jgi:plasmid maintenance system antidote protein VapI
MGISRPQFVKNLQGDWTLPKLCENIDGKRGITEQIAFDFSATLGTTPQFWLNLQNNCEFKNLTTESPENTETGKE